MSGRILVRGSDGALQEFPIRARLNIGSSAPSDVVIDGDGVLPLHATAELREQDCWIEAAGGGRIAINGQPVTKRALRHLDVITLGENVHVIYSTSSTPLPQAQSGRPKRPAAAPNTAAAPNATQMFTRGDLAAPAFSPPMADAPPVPTNTIVGVPVATFTPPDAPPPTNTIVGMPIDVAAPAFAEDMPLTKEFRAPAVTPFTPTEATSEASGPRPIHIVRLTGAAGVFEAPLGRSIIGRGSKATLRIDSSEVSRVHAVLTVDTDGVTIEDRESVNGTRINGERITGEHVLAEGDLVSLGTIDLRVDFVRLGGGE